MTEPAEFVVKNSLLLLIAYWDFHYTMRNWLKIIKSFICCIICKVNSCKINTFLAETIWISWNSNTVLLAALTVHAVQTSTIQCILTDFLLILSNMNFLSPSWFYCTSRPEVILQSDDFAFVPFLDRRKSFLLKSSCDFWIFYYALVENKAIRIVIFEWFLDDLNVKKLFWMNVSASCADFFNRFDILDLSWLLWIIESLKWLTLVIENRMIEVFV